MMNRKWRIVNRDRTTESFESRMKHSLSISTRVLDNTEQNLTRPSSHLPIYPFPHFPTSPLIPFPILKQRFQRIPCIRFPGPCNLFLGSRRHDAAATGSAFGSKIDDVIGALDYIQ